MPNCIVNGCSFRWRKKDPDVALHVFPKDMGTIRSWLLHINQDFGDLDEFCHKIFHSSKGTYRICSQHFALDAYEVRGMVTFLKKDAVPTIFLKEEFKLPTRKRRKKTDPISQADTFTAANLPFTSTDFPDCVKLEMPWSPETSHCLDLNPNYFGAPSVHSHIHPGPPEEMSPYKSEHYRPRSTRTVGTSMDYFPGQVHRSTQLNNPMGTKDKNLQTQLIPLNRSVGIQCNLEDLPSLPLWSAVSGSEESRLCSCKHRTKLLHHQSNAYLHDERQ